MSVEDDIIAIDDTTIQSSSGSFAKVRFALKNGQLWYHLIEQPCGSYGHMKAFCILDGDDDNNGVLNHLELVPESVVEDESTKSIVQVHPNPAVDKVKVQFTDKTKSFHKLFLFDQNGTNIWKRGAEQFSNSIQYINTYELVSGIYTLQVIDQEGSSHFVRFTKI